MMTAIEKRTSLTKTDYRFCRLTNSLKWKEKQE
jgi:hypothetical protein